MKQYQVIFAPEARDDLFVLYDWIAAASSPDTALSYIERIEPTVAALLTHAAERGTRRDDTVELYNRVRRACHVDGMNKSEAARVFGITQADAYHDNLQPAWRTALHGT